MYCNIKPENDKYTKNKWKYETIQTCNHAWSIPQRGNYFKHIAMTYYDFSLISAKRYFEICSDFWNKIEISNHL